MVQSNTNVTDLKEQLSKSQKECTDHKDILVQIRAILSAELGGEIFHD